MATAFDTFDQFAIGHYAGQIEDRGLADVVSRAASGGDIGYGLAVTDVDERSAELVDENTGEPMGITARESVRDNEAGDNPAAVYPEDHEMSVVRVGRIWVTTVDGAAPGEPVYVVEGTGALTNDDDNEANPEFPGATFKSTAGAGELALVQLNGNK